VGILLRYHGAGVDLYRWRKCDWRLISAEGGASRGLYVCRVVWLLMELLEKLRAPQVAVSAMMETWPVRHPS
jgi:hypothetical protein